MWANLDRFEKHYRCFWDSAHYNKQWGHWQEIVLRNEDLSGFGNLTGLVGLKTD